MATLLLASEMPVPISRAPRRPIPARRPPLPVPAGPLLAPDAPAGGAPDGKRNRKCRLPPLGPHDAHSDSWKGSNEFWILPPWAGPPGVRTPTASHNVDACVHSVLVVAEAGGWTGGLRWCYIHKRRRLVRSGSNSEGRHREGGEGGAQGERGLQLRQHLLAPRRGVGAVLFY